MIGRNLEEIAMSISRTKSVLLEIEIQIQTVYFCFQAVYRMLRSEFATEPRWAVEEVSWHGGMMDPYRCKSATLPAPISFPSLRASTPHCFNSIFGTIESCHCSRGVQLQPRGSDVLGELH